MDRERPRLQPLAVERGEHGAPTQRDNGVSAGEGLGEHVLLEAAKLGLALLEELGDRPVPGLDLGVEVDERPVRQLGHLPADRRLAGAHEAGERQVAP